jgi:hypothetical protein
MGFKFNPITGNLDLVGSGSTTNVFTSSIIGEYKIDANNVGGNPAPGHIRYDNATQISALNITIDHISHNGINIDPFIPLLLPGSVFVIQDKNDPDSYQIWIVSDVPIHSGADYWTIPVTLSSSAGTGTTGFPNNDSVIVAATNAAPAAPIDLVSYTQFGGF